MVTNEVNPPKEENAEGLKSEGKINSGILDLSLAAAMNSDSADSPSSDESDVTEAFDHISEFEASMAVDSDWESVGMDEDWDGISVGESIEFDGDDVITVD